MPDRPRAVLNRPTNRRRSADQADPAPPFAVVAPLLGWAESGLRDLPWRNTRDPWAVLVSEVMLQQTQVTRVLERWSAFLGRFPTVDSCAGATAGEVIELWSGLGYNRRAVNLWRAATEIRDRFGGDLPQDVLALESLPGVGPYTARAVAVFAFEADVGVVDTNVGRLLARWVGRSVGPRYAQVVADALVPPGNSWRWNQTLFDFASGVCTKRAPSCDTCPVWGVCGWQGVGPDPAAGSAGVSTPQGRFEGSRRQVRGRVLAVLRDRPATLIEIQTAVSPGSHDVDSILADLVGEGLVAVDGGTFRLP